MNSLFLQNSFPRSLLNTVKPNWLKAIGYMKGNFNIAKLLCKSLCKSASEKGKPQQLAIFHDSCIVIIKPQPLPFSIIYLKVILNIHQYTGLHVQIMLVYEEKGWPQSKGHIIYSLHLWNMLLSKYGPRWSPEGLCWSPSTEQAHLQVWTDDIHVGMSLGTI